MINQKHLDKSIKQVDGLAKEFYTFDVSTDITDALTSNLNETRNTIIRSMRNTKRHPTKRYRVGKGRFHRPSLAGHPPAISTGELRDSYMFDVHKNQGAIGSKKNYSKWLEKGTKHMQHRPHLTPAVDKHKKRFFRDLADITGMSVKEIMLRTGVQEL